MDLEQISTIRDRLMAPNQSTRQGAERSAIWLIGQVRQRRRWDDLIHQMVPYQEERL